MITFSDIKNYIIEYHNNIKARLDFEYKCILRLENEYDLMVKKNHISEIYKIDSEYDLLFENILLQEIDMIKKEYESKGKKVESFCEDNLKLLTDINLPINGTIKEVLTNENIYYFCYFVENKKLNETYEDEFPRGLMLFFDWFLSDEELVYLK